MKTIGASLKLPASNWRPPGRIKKKSREKPLGRNFRLSGLNPGIFRTIIIFVLLMFLSSQIHPINAQPIEGNLTPAASRRIEIVAALPSHFRVDDPESTGFGRRIRINPNRSGGNPGFSGSRIRAIPDSEEEDQVVQPSTLEEVKAARVRKRNFSTSVISERTIQIGDGGGKSNKLTTTSQAKAPNEKLLSRTTSTTTTRRNPSVVESTTSPATTVNNLGIGSSRAVIRFVSTVAPVPLKKSTQNPPGSETNKASIRTVLRRPPLSFQKASESTTARTTSNSTSTLATQRKTRVRLRDSLLARVQGRHRARSTTTTQAPQTLEPGKTTVVTLRPVDTTARSSTTTTTSSTTEESTPASTTPTTTTTTTSTTTTTTTKPEVTTLPTTSTQETTLPEEVATETSVSISIKESRVSQTTSRTTQEPFDTTIYQRRRDHEVSTLRNLRLDADQEEEDATTIDSLEVDDTTESDEIDEELDTTTIQLPSTTTQSTTPRPPEGLLGNSLGRPNDGLQKELLAAIRRKISKTKTNNKTQDEEENALASTSHPPVFRSIPLTNNQGQRLPGGGGTRPNRVKIFLRVPDAKPGSNVKIPNFSHIQGKLQRLNAAITEGLRNDRIQALEKLRQANNSRATTTTTTTVKPDNKVLTATSISSVFSVQTTSRPRIGSYERSSTTTTSTIPPPTRRHGLTTKPSKSKGEPSAEAPIAGKTHTYLDVLRQRIRKSSTSTTTTATTTTTTKVTTTELRTEQTLQEVARTSHFRPKDNVRTTSSTTEKADVRVVRPVYGIPTLVKEQIENDVLKEANADNDNESEESVIHDITGTTVYVVGVICVIPAAGLMAWVVRYVVKKRETSSSENGSETGLNCPISDDDMIQVPQQTRYPQDTANKRKSMVVEPDEPDVDDIDCSASNLAIKDALNTSVWQIPRTQLKLQTVLGEGNFGKVWKAEAENICGYEGTVLVAVKTTKEKAPDKEKTDLLQEMQIMQKIGHHPNVVTLLGVSIEKEPYLLVMEYVMYGKLLTHLREQRSKNSSMFNFSGDNLNCEQSEDSTITAKDLTKYAYGVAKGMEYIVSKQIIHRDLAARNILIDHTRTCKISDFGLSRNLGDTGSEMYEQKTKGALPIRWMAPESLYFSVFTPKSDVWSFGILMWEIVTLGSTPYPGMGAREVMRKVRDGYRLERPAHCHPDLYKIISKCWAGDMNKRPDFTEIRLELAKLLEHQHGYIDLQNIPENKYYSMTQTSDEDEKL